MLFVALPVQAAPHTGTSVLTIRLISTDEEGTTLIDRKPQHKVSKGDVIRVTSNLHNQVAQLGKPKGAFIGWATMILTVVTTSQGMRAWTRASWEEGSMRKAAYGLATCRRTR